MDQIKIGKFLQELRKEKGLTQEQLAEAMGVTVGTVSKWENGNCVPDINTMMDLITNMLSSAALLNTPAKCICRVELH